MLIRVPSLTATAIPLLAGGAIAFRTGKFYALLWADMFIIALFMQIATNVFNEHGDYVHGIDRFVSHGFSGVIVKGEASAREVLEIALSFYVAAAILAIPLLIKGGSLVLVLGLLAASVGFLYSEGPLPLSNTPLGEVFVGLTMGLIEVIATEFVSSGKITASAYFISVSISLLVSAILIANNIRDIQKDRQVKRKTLVVIIGDKYAAALFCAVIAFSYLWLPVIWILTGNFFINLPILTLPVVIWGAFYLHKNGWKYGVEISSALYLLYGLALTLALLI
jgi:1,4-dihydroxy-2-naphthoate octaprenyltransferase